jgi:hypothetical protein
VMGMWCIEIEVRTGSIQTVGLGIVMEVDIGIETRVRIGIVVGIGIAVGILKEHSKDCTRSWGNIQDKNFQIRELEL